MYQKLAIIFLLSLTACTSIKHRHQQEHFLQYKSATCERTSVFSVDSKRTILAKNRAELEAGRKLFDLNGLSSSEVTETYCGPYCEPPGARIQYTPGIRTNSDEMYLTSPFGNRSIRLNFTGKSYQLVIFDGSPNITIESGTCNFTPVQ
ncbi:MAG: hypothetical protein KDD38_01475 [Bdellovibrionales bacterium]|nr:hypothetical protein [Bdellovibrionales bacterium]